MAINKAVVCAVSLTTEGLCFYVILLCSCGHNHTERITERAGMCGALCLCVWVCVVKKQLMCRLYLSCHVSSCSNEREIDQSPQKMC